MMMSPVSPINPVRDMCPDVTSCSNDIKIILTGSVYVGKTSLFQRFTNDDFEDQKSYMATVSGAFSSKKIMSNNWKITLNVWDTAGSERFKAMSTMFFRAADAAIVCFDLTSPGSFEEALVWISDVKATEPECKIYLCGTKKDLVDEGMPRAEPENKILRFAEGIQSSYFETSSKTGENVDELFTKIADDYTAEPANIRKLEDTVKLQIKGTKRDCCRII